MTSSTMTSSGMAPDHHGQIDNAPEHDLLLDAGHEHAAPDLFPRLTNMSAAFMFEKIIRAEVPAPPEYVTVPLTVRARDEQSLLLGNAVARWNLAWEAAQFRRRMFDEQDLPRKLHEVADRGDFNVAFVPRTRTRYYEYAPLMHLLPRTTLERFGLPLLRAGMWPYLAEAFDLDQHLPTDFLSRLGRAWAATVWRHMVPGSALRGFTSSDPIRLLAHNLDFWIPPVTQVVQEVLRGLDVVDEDFAERVPRPVDESVLEGAVIASPRRGTDVWCGQDEAAEMVAWTVKEADADGRLRGILDAVRCHRVEDDFSGYWTYAREDFERKLYRKRNKIKVRFVELTDTIPVQGPEAEVIDRVVMADFMALLNERDREVVVLLSSGVTRLAEIARIMGYRNHSPVSKRLREIRRQAELFFDR